MRLCLKEDKGKVIVVVKLVTCFVLVSDIAIFVLKRDVKLQLTNLFRPQQGSVHTTTAVQHGSHFGHLRRLAAIDVIIIRSHRSTTYVDAAYCYRLSRVVCPSVCRSVTLVSPCKNGWTDRDALWVENSYGLRKPCIRWESRSPNWKGQFWGKGAPTVKYSDFMLWAVQKRLNQSICDLGCGLGLAQGSTSLIVFSRWR